MPIRVVLLHAVINENLIKSNEYLSAQQYLIFGMTWHAVPQQFNYDLLTENAGAHTSINA